MSKTDPTDGGILVAPWPAPPQGVDDSAPKFFTGHPDPIYDEAMKADAERLAELKATWPSKRNDALIAVYEECAARGRTFGGLGVSALEVRFWSKVSFARGGKGCWLWHGSTVKDGYGAFRLEGKIRKAHRVSLLLASVDVPSGLVVDHLCSVRNCVNPAHLDPVSQKTNARRGRTGAHMSSRTHCPAGHPHGERNKRGERVCKECHRVRNKNWAANKRKKEGTI